MPLLSRLTPALAAGLLVLLLAGLAPRAPASASLPTAAPASASVSASATDDTSALPVVHNISSLTDERARALVTEGLSGLGFVPGAPDGPRPDDRVVVADTYVAWIDETGFYGKLNGLWWLSPTASGDRSFSHRDPDGRPVNQLIVGENGDGAWPIGFRGAEHIEVPNDTPEPHHDPSCADGWCGAYSHDEAGAYTAPLIPWWRVCDPGSLGYLDHVAPVEASVTGTTVRLVYEGRLVKTADSKAPWTDDTGCREDWLFRDGVRRPVYLRVGYEFTAADPWIDRIQQIRNPAGNPPFEGPYSLIGGFEVTTWPNPRPDKEVTRFLRPETADVWDFWKSRTLTAATWNEGFTETVGVTDLVLAWLGQPVSFSPVPAWTHARSLRISHLGPRDNRDVAFCICLYHGSIELGGGLLHSEATTLAPGDAALPVDGGAQSIEARRRLETAPATVIADVPPWTRPAAGPPTTAPPAATAPTAPPAQPVTVTPAFTG